MSRKTIERRSDCPYHVTARTNNKDKFELDLSEVWRIFEDQLYFIHHAFGVRIHSFVLMNNHFHLIISDPDLKLDQALRWLMTETSREIGRQTGKINRVWGQRNYKCLVGNYHYYLHVYKYVYRNPIEAGISIKAEDYPFSTLSRMLGKKQLAFPIIDDLLMSDLEQNLRWLNANVDKEDWDCVRKALRKCEFKLAKTKNRNEMSHLESRLL